MEKKKFTLVIFPATIEFLPSFSYVQVPHAPEMPKEAYTKSKNEY